MSGETLERLCPKCGTIMCEGFDMEPSGVPGVTLAIPNRKFECMKCRGAKEFHIDAK